jgi:hypothetical protein
MRNLCAALIVAASLGACSNELKVSEVEPSTGTFNGGEDIVIHGNGFQPGRGVTVRFGHKEAQSVVVASPTKMQVTTPSGDENTTVDVSVIFDDGKAFMIKNGFHFVGNTQRATRDKAFNAFGAKPEDKK